MRSKLLTMAAAVLVLALGIPTLFAMPEYDEFYTYYSDDTYQTVVGHEYYLCHGTYRDGYMTDYYNRSVGESCDSSPLDPFMREPGNCYDNYDNDGDGPKDCFDPDCWQYCS
jgi:hypothetical protein